MKVHYQEKMAAFVDHELNADEHREIAEHILLCSDCRKLHDEVKLGASLSAFAGRVDAPREVWDRIESALNQPAEVDARKSTLMFRFAAAAIFLFIGVAAIATLVYRSKTPALGLRPAETADVADQPAVNNSPDKLPRTVDNEIARIGATPQEEPRPRPSVEKVVIPNDPKSRRRPEMQSAAVTRNLRVEKAGWNVDILGEGKANDGLPDTSKLGVGETLETNELSRAVVEVADIGRVEMEPNSRLRLIETRSSRHRIALDRGKMKAKIFAPPRIFVVETPTATAVDLGCEYTLEVDGDGNTRLHVTGGFVSLERAGRATIVPSGAVALTRKGKDVGTPFADDASEAFVEALSRVDFTDYSDKSLRDVLTTARVKDSISLWHLLSRVRAKERGEVFDALSERVKPPRNVTRAGVLTLEKAMLDDWWLLIEENWYE